MMPAITNRVIYKNPDSNKLKRTLVIGRRGKVTGKNK